MRSFSSKLTFLAAAFVTIGAVSPGCTKAQLNGTAPSYAIVDQLLASSGARPSEFGGTLGSDVQTYVKVTIDGKEARVPTVYEDIAKVTFRLALKDPGTPTTPTSPTPTNYITFTRYHVKFVRSDGRNTQGVDVPYAFDGAATVTVGEAPTEMAFTIVRVQAKQEAPLMALISGGGATVISTLAEVTFYGQDQAGHQVTTVAYISVNFADWGDPS